MSLATSSSAEQVIIQHHSSGGGSYQLPSSSVSARYFEHPQLTTIVSAATPQTLMSLSPTDTAAHPQHAQHADDQQQTHHQLQTHQQAHHLVESAATTVNLGSLGTAHQVHQVQTPNGGTSYVYEYYKVPEKDAGSDGSELHWR